MKISVSCAVVDTRHIGSAAKILSVNKEAGTHTGKTRTRMWATLRTPYLEEVWSADHSKLNKPVKPSEFL